MPNNTVGAGSPMGSMSILPTMSFITRHRISLVVNQSGSVFNLVTFTRSPHHCSSIVIVTTTTVTLVFTLITSFISTTSSIGCPAWGWVTLLAWVVINCLSTCLGCYRHWGHSSLSSLTVIGYHHTPGRLAGLGSIINNWVSLPVRFNRQSMGFRLGWLSSSAFVHQLVNTMAPSTVNWATTTTRSSPHHRLGRHWVGVGQ